MRYSDNRDSGTGFALGILAGAIVGAGVALLFAPKAGAHLREDIGESAASLRDAVARRYRDLADRAGVEVEGLSETVDKATAQVENSARDLMDSAARTVKSAASRA